MEIRYRIGHTYDREHQIKEIPEQWKTDSYSVEFLTVGKPASLKSDFIEGMSLRLTPVEEIMMHNNQIRITTQNTIYFLEPYIKTEGGEQ